MRIPFRHGLTATAILTLLAAAGCGGTKMSKVALLSDGNLGGKRLDTRFDGPTLRGEDCGIYQHLANAFRNATKGTAYDTLVNVDITNTNGAFMPSNCIIVQGTGVKSGDLPSAEGSR